MNTPQPRHIRIFLSSPGDVADERGLALKVIDQLPYDPLLRGKVTLEVAAWDKKGAGVPMLATLICPVSWLCSKRRRKLTALRRLSRR